MSHERSGGKFRGFLILVALVGVEAGHALLGDGTEVIVGPMDDALDFNHPCLAGVDETKVNRGEG